MREKKKNQDNNSFDVLKNKIEIIEIEPNKKMQIFFNLLYLKPSIHFTLAQNPILLLKESQNTESQINIYEACAIILACNMQNVDFFLKIPSFWNLCTLFSKASEQLPSKLYNYYIQCIQASILYHIDTKSMRNILKHIKILRENGIISFHDEKCLEAVIQTDKLANTTKNMDTKAIQTHSFIQLNPAKTLFKEQLECLVKIKKVLESMQWSKELVFLCKGDFVKNICIVGGKKTGKSTLLATLFYDDAYQNNKILEAIAPLHFHYGKEISEITYLQSSDLKSIQETPVEKIAYSMKNISDEFQTSLKRGKEKIAYQNLWNECYANDKVHIVNNIKIAHNHAILKYVNFINTPSLIPITFRHLQIYRYIAKSNIVLYLIGTESLVTSESNDLERDSLVLSRLITRNHIDKIYIVYTQMDKVNLTSKKRQDFCLKLKNAIDNKLSLQSTQKRKQMKKLHFYFVASKIAYNIRHEKILIDNGFDIASSGILELEQQLFTDIFHTPIKQNNIQTLQAILTLYQKNYTAKINSHKVESQDIDEHSLLAISENLYTLETQMYNAIKKLPSKYSSMYNAFINLRDNLYTQFIQSLSYEVKKRSNFNVQRLKTSTIESLIIGLQGLSDMLQDHCLSLVEFETINNILNPKAQTNLTKFATLEHKNILEILQNQFHEILHKSIFNDSHVIVAGHLENCFNKILPNNIRKNDIQEDSVIAPIKESFDYYFLLLERNIDTLFHEKLEKLESFMISALKILDSVFIKYYKDQADYGTINQSLIETLQKGGE